MIKKASDFFNSNWKNDLNAGFSVSLIALPLSLAIATASGFPPISGVISAIIGGLVISRISGSYVSIYGAAAGLIVVNLGAVQSLGGVEYALAAIFIAGLMIFIFGLLKAGGLSDFFPASVVQGMLTSIGIIIFIKQIYVVFGVENTGDTLIGSVIQLPQKISKSEPNILIISFISFLILFIFPKIKAKLFKVIPVPVWLITISIVVSSYLQIDSNQLIHLPSSLTENLILPDFSKVGLIIFWKVVITIALITSLESLLSSIAIDSLDPLKRKSNLNKDMSAIGIGSSLASLVGGLPMISEIVRGSSNISHGAKTQLANFFHGLFLLLFVLLGTSIINLIPLATLAMMLLFVGVRLINFKKIYSIYKLGFVEFTAFLITVIGVLITDLLVGIIMGLIAELILHIVKGFRIKDIWILDVDVVEKGNRVELSIKSGVIFINHLHVKKMILKHSKNKEVELQFKDCLYLSYSSRQKFLHLIDELKRIE